MQMSFMSWMLLVFLLSTTGTVGAVDEAWLTRVVEIIRTEYSFRGQVCIAVNIPEGVNPDNLLADLRTDDSYQGNVENVLNSGDVYTGRLVVAASYSEVEQAHAEPRVLEAMQSWNVEPQGNFLIFYTFLSPCALRCATESSDQNILNTLADTLYPWGDSRALVFGKPCTKLGQKEISSTEIQQSLNDLAEYGFGDNIFRCYKPPTPDFQCFWCFGDFADQCIVDSEGQGGTSQGPSCPSGSALIEIGMDISVSTGGGPSGSGSRGRSPSGRGSRGRSPSRGGSRGSSPSGGSSRGRSPSGRGSRGSSPSGGGSRGRSPSGGGSRGRSPSGGGSRGSSPSGRGSRGRSPSGGGSRGRSPGGRSSRGRSPGGRGSRSRSRSGSGSRGRSGRRSASRKRRRFGDI